MLQKSEIVAGDLVLRGALVFLVIQIGWDYQEGFALCRELKENPREYWIMQSLLRPVCRASTEIPPYPMPIQSSLLPSCPRAYPPFHRVNVYVVDDHRSV